MNHVIHLPEYGFLSISGKDATKFFQGYTTCELNDLNSTQSAIGATCNLKGRMLASYRIISIDDGLLMRMDRCLVEPMIEFLKKYIVFSKASLHDLSDSYRCYGQITDASDSTGSTNTIISCPPEKDHWLQTMLGPVICVESENSDTKSAPATDTKTQRCELWLDGSSAPEQSLPVSDSDADLWHQAEIAQGLAWVTTETSEEFIPQMFDYDKVGAISFEKGCYLGQEIVARMQSRGAVKRRLHTGSATSKQATGTTLLDAKGRNTGMIVASSSTNFLAVVQVHATDQAGNEEQQDEGHWPIERNLLLANGESVEVRQLRQ